MVRIAVAGLPRLGVPLMHACAVRTGMAGPCGVAMMRAQIPMARPVAPLTALFRASLHTSRVVMDKKPARKSSGVLSQVVSALRDMASSRPTQGKSSQYPAVRRLMELMRPELRGIVLALGLLLIASLVSLSVPFTIGKVVDFFSQPDARFPFGLTMPTVATLLLCVFATGALARASSNILLELTGVRVIQRIRERAFSNALRQDVSFADKGAGDTVSRINMDCNLVGGAITTDLADGLRSTVTVLASCSAMFYISTKLTLVMMLVIPPAALCAAYYGRFLRNLTNKTQDAVGVMTRTAEELSLIHI